MLVKEITKMPDSNRYIIGSQKDGNIAIKCNYCDGGRDANRIGFSGVCSDRVIKYNIEDVHRAWCSNSRCLCYQYYEGKVSRDELEREMSAKGKFVCYESTMLSDWKTQAGLTEDEQPKSFGSTLHKGAVCVFTTRLPGMDENSRFVFGLFIIDEIFYGNNNKSGYVKCNTDYHIELTADETKAIKFWNYYRNKNNPERLAWGTGLYRFISNNAIIALLTDLIQLRQGDQKDDVILFLDEFCRLNNLKMPELGEETALTNIPSDSSENDKAEKIQLEIESQAIEKEIENKNLVGTDKLAVVRARVNQGLFRERLLRKYNKCCICGVDEESLLVASHIKPWVDSTPKERVDDNNGLLLCPNHDKLFDRGFISFDDDGSILISESLSENNRMFLNVNSDIKIMLDPAVQEYMKYHRENIFCDNNEPELIVQEVIEDEQNNSVDELPDEMPPVVPAKKLGPLPDSLLNYAVYDDRYGNGIIVNVIPRSFQFEVKFDDEDEFKTFVFPDCFLSGRLSLRKREDQIALNEHLRKYKQ